MTDDVKTLVAQRKGHRSYATKLLKQVDDLLSNAEKDKVKLRAHAKLLSERLGILDGLNLNILESLKDDDSIEREIEECGDYQKNILETLAEIDDALDTLSKTAIDERSKADSLRPDMKCAAKLPKLVLKPFSGDVLEFQEFWESFESAIHKKDDLDGLTKFNYLRSLLSSEAASTIGGLSLTAENYDEAVTLLQSRFGNK